MRKTYGASEFKAQCLQVLDQVKETGEEYIITKHILPVVNQRFSTIQLLQAV